MEDEEVDLDETEVEAGYVLSVDGPDGLTFMAKDLEGRCIETCHLELEGSYEDVAASAQDLVEFLRKFGPDHSFEASES